MARLPHSAIEHQVLDLSLNGRSEPARSPGSAYPPGSCISSAGPVPLATDSATDTSKAASTVPEYSCSRRHYRRLIAGVRCALATYLRRVEDVLQPRRDAAAQPVNISGHPTSQRYCQQAR
jgi:hypothetical protein